MADLTQFVGTWIADAGPPFSVHTFTWKPEGSRLRGRWLIEAPDSPAARAAAAAGRPQRVDMQIGDAWLEDGLLLFHVNGAPFVAEFRPSVKARRSSERRCTSCLPSSAGRSTGARSRDIECA